MSEPTCRILIAEDEPRIASFMAKGLRRSGFATTVVADGNLALAAAIQEPFDLLLLDLGLPGKAGEEVLRELRHQGQTLPVIVVTARSIEARDQHAAQMLADASALMCKPFPIKELIAQVRAALVINP